MKEDLARSEALWKRIRVMIVDDHAVVRQGLRSLIATERDMEVVAETGDVDDVVPLFAMCQPDVVLMDLRLRDGSGVDAIRTLRTQRPGSRILVFSYCDGEEHVFRAIEAGAKGYLTKSAEAAQILEGLRAVHNGHRYLSPDASARLAESVHRSPLTGREGQVLSLLARGGRNRGIAGALGIAEETVKGHVKNILSKLGVRDRAHATSEAIRRGLLEVD